MRRDLAGYARLRSDRVPGHEGMRRKLLLDARPRGPRRLVVPPAPQVPGQRRRRRRERRPDRHPRRRQPRPARGRYPSARTSPTTTATASRPRRPRLQRPARRDRVRTRPAPRPRRRRRPRRPASHADRRQLDATGGPAPPAAARDGDGRRPDGTGGDRLAVDGGNGGSTATGTDTAGPRRSGNRHGGDAAAAPAADREPMHPQADRNPDGTPTDTEPRPDDRRLRPGADRRPQLRHRPVHDPAVPAADLPGLRNPVRDPLAGARLDQPDRDRVRHQPQRLDRRRRRLDAVPALDLGELRRRRQRRRPQGPLQPGRRDLRRGPLPARPPAARRTCAPRSSPTTTPTGTSTRCCSTRASTASSPTTSSARSPA